MYLVLSAFTSSPNSLLATSKVSGFPLYYVRLKQMNYALEKKNMNQILDRERCIEDILLLMDCRNSAFCPQSVFVIPVALAISSD